ncbi:DUF2000 domain-containing protein [Candidatus Accumulibacter phosphatis]|jgi:hypothetical protein|uniref:DUF2000 domain-containing protein n=1 Tax=Candidatus Accumulibacter phosphatis TaxID=327160 RepID=UPI00110A4588|nr:DUF2000 domain-containing protein [Candidatus Accumulibacter phosphatis]
MDYDYRNRKTVIAIATELAPGIAGNVIGHLALAVGHRIAANDMGKHPLVDATGVEHSGISRYPVIVVTAKSARLRKLISEAREVGGLLLADYPEQMLSTGHDDELSTAIAGTPEGSFRYLGVALHGDTKQLQPLTGKFSLWGNSTTNSTTSPNVKESGCDMSPSPKIRFPNGF